MGINRNNQDNIESSKSVSDFATNSIIVKNLSKKYDKFSLKDISISVPKGSIMGLIGENGAGKTTTIKLILNQIKRDSGEIKILGFDNIKDEKLAKSDIGVVFDESYFHENLKPVQISKVMKKIHKNWDSELFFNYLDKFSLPFDKPAKSFSRGMKMKLSIATALSHHPKLLILDEPTSGLDPIIRNEILDIFLDFIQDENRSILFSSHITSDLEKIADYITFLHNGEIVFCESKDSLIYNYGMLLCGRDDFHKIDKTDIVGFRDNKFGYEILIKDKESIKSKYSEFVIDSVNIEDIMLFYVKGESLQ